MLLWQPRFGFSFGFEDRMRPHLVVILDGCQIERYLKFSYMISIDIANYIQYSSAQFVMM